jgi:PIN domain nuclease of toxin-antitoxin system
MGNEPLMLLLDSNIWFKYYWRLHLPEQLQRRMETEELAFSPISALEIATKIRKDIFPAFRRLSNGCRRRLMAT